MPSRDFFGVWIDGNRAAVENYNPLATNLLETHVPNGYKLSSICYNLEHGYVKCHCSIRREGIHRSFY